MKEGQEAGPTRKILVVDDNPIIRRTVYFQFKDRGFTVLMAGDIAESLAIIRSEFPDVILLDLNFPAAGLAAADSWDGYWAMDYLHWGKETKNIPIIAISSTKPAEAEPKALAAGAKAFFPKPIDKEKLLAKIQELIDGTVPHIPPTSSPTLRMSA